MGDFIDYFVSGFVILLLQFIEDGLAEGLPVDVAKGDCLCGFAQAGVLIYLRQDGAAFFERFGYFLKLVIGIIHCG